MVRVIKILAPSFAQRKKEIERERENLFHFILNSSSNLHFVFANSHLTYINLKHNLL